MSLSPGDELKIADAIRAAERKTSAEIVCVLARSSSEYAALPILWSSIAALLLPWALVALTQMSVQRILLLQAVAFAVLLAILSLPAMRVKLAPPGLRRASAHRAAMQQFMIRGLSRKKDRTGVLVFVSLAERYVRIVADDGVTAKIAQKEWQDAVDIMLTHLRHGAVGDGFIAAVERCGDLLAAHFPPRPDGSSELPDRNYVI